jgi:hypothetical protein
MRSERRHPSLSCVKKGKLQTTVLALSIASSEFLMVHRMARIASKLSPSSFFPESLRPSASWSQALAEKI